MQPDARCEWLTVVGDETAWRSLGLTGRSEPDGSFLVPLLGTALRIVSPGSAGVGDAAPEPDAGVSGWALSGVDASAAPSIDGLATEVVEPMDPVWAGHELGAVDIDHVVVLTDDLSRTSAAVESATGCELKRVREVGEMRQGFHRLGRGGLIVEIVARPDVPAGPATFWGLVLNVEDLDAACAGLGDLVGEAKDAVQPGRRIATVRREAGLGLPLALMSPDRR